jgi:hypothetical protein
LDVQKRKVDWTNPREIEPFLMEIAREQYAKCGLVLGEDVSEDVPILAFANYVEQRKMRPGGRLGKFNLLPRDRMPNIPRMEVQLQADVAASKSKRINLYDKVAKTASSMSGVPRVTVAERLAKASPTDSPVLDPYGNSVLYNILSWPITKFANFAGINNYKYDETNPFKTVNIL